MLLKHPWVIALGFFMVMFIAACGSSTTPGVVCMAAAIQIHLLQRLVAEIPQP